MGPIIPGMRPGYRTTTSMFKWILLIAILGGIAMVLVFRAALRDVDDIYRNAGYPEKDRFFPDKPAKK